MASRFPRQESARLAAEAAERQEQLRLERERQKRMASFQARELAAKPYDAMVRAVLSDLNTVVYAGKYGVNFRHFSWTWSIQGWRDSWEGTLEYRHPEQESYDVVKVELIFDSRDRPTGFESERNGYSEERHVGLFGTETVRTFACGLRERELIATLNRIHSPKTLF
jgi:hypothetical protein